MADEERPTKMRGSIVEATQVFQEKDKIYEFFLAVLDFLFSTLVITPCVVGCWRSQWELMDFFCYPDDQALSASISTGIGLCGNLFLNFIQRSMDETFHPDNNRVLYYIVSRTYSIFYAFVCVNWFRGVWQLLDLFTPGDLISVSATTAGAMVVLALFRSLRNISSPPLVVATDERQGYFQVLTIFRTVSSEKRELYILDCLFSTAGIGTLVVTAWRGGFQLLDLLVFPENRLLSYWVTLCLGYIIVTIAFSLQNGVRWICKHLKILPRIIFGDIFIVFAAFGTINIWRGMWDLLDHYFLPDQRELSNWLVYWVSLILLILLGCSNSLLVRGVFIDAEEPGGDSMIFPCHFIRNKLSKQRTKKNLAALHQAAARTNAEVDDKANKENHNFSYAHSVQIKEYSA
ncbi:uncharacterized protein LOC123313879 isoform X1 [Coccinella septempunctata]|uniref:uncharacterized protein LOC123313879 isoform X1 n=1 Tax=Coccinella septempunctata TaxID=41139 RepID=UPI001D074140|nr:uncharacterized protein LOC123313879 isoform X1 [Coccinella septempunctata]